MNTTHGLPDRLAGAVRWHHRGGPTIVLVVERPLTRPEVPEFGRQAQQLLEETGARQVVCDVGAVDRPCAILMESLARLQVVARRLGGQVRLRNADSDILALLALMGLRDVLLPLWHWHLPVGMRRQTEHGVQLLGVEEGVEPDDPSV